MRPSSDLPSRPGHSGYRVTLVLPPDPQAPEAHRRHRFPHQGPALVAGSIALDGVACRIADLELDADPGDRHAALDDEARLERHLRGGCSEELVALARGMIDRLAGLGLDVDVDAFALSIDRHTQVDVSLLLGVELKRRYGRPVILGGGNARAAWLRLEAIGALGIDLVTTASTPHEIRAAFGALRGVAPGRWELAREPLAGPLPTAPDDWPLPDFSAYELARYRRDPFAADGPLVYPRYDGSVGPRLFLPYHFAFDCQYVCTFCQRGGTQGVKSMERVVRDLATMAERYGCLDFMLFDAQINLHAEAFSRALIGARLGVHWTDSFRVAPRRPMDVLDHMAEAGCVGLTLGVESASDRMLKRMVKGHTSAQATRFVRDAHEREMFVRVNLLPCFPGERPEDHAVTRAWVAEMAGCIDEVVPSSFYLAEGSPVGQSAERHGIVLRGERALSGDHKFRKNLGSLEFDEVGGYTWEEREAMLRPAEDDLRAAWREGREAFGAAIEQPSQAFALRRDSATKREAYARVQRWLGAGSAPPEEEDPAVLDPAPDLAAALAPPVVPEEPPPVAPPPPGSLRARVLAAVRRMVAPLGLGVAPLSGDPSRFSIHLDDAAGAGLTLHLEAAHPGVRYFKRGARTMLWYTKVTAGSPSAGEPRWVAPVLEAAGRGLCAPAFDGIADELAAAVLAAAAVAPPPPPIPSAPPPPPPLRPLLRSFSVVDLVRRGLKPAASLLVDDGEAALRDFADLPARALSPFGYGRDAFDNLVPVDAPAPGGPRMLYVGRSERDVERMCAVEHALFARRGAPGVDRAALQEELGRLLGFPPCCAAAYARRSRAAGGHADYYASVAQLGWHLAPIDWRCNHVAARQYELPFLNQVPCGSGCQATRDQVERVTTVLYEPPERRVLEDVLSQGAVVWPDDRVAFFAPRGLPDADGELPVAAFNVDAHAAALRAPRPPRRRIPADASDGVRDAEVTRLRVRGGRLEVFAAGAWAACAPSAASREAPPLVLTVRPRAPRRVALTVLPWGAVDGAPAVGE
ncbi:MAG: radical SAM protein [Deltaproteobacteria bacterium]|nr:radical SAM protein [Deltaproteobacteria bacterium]